MKRHVEMTLMAGAALLLMGGCATKKYVAQRVDPVNGKLEQVDKNQQNTQKQLEATEPKISAADEKATAADARAGDALNRADAASKKSDTVRDQLRGELNDRIANLDDYKSAKDVTVLFKFNSAGGEIRRRWETVGRLTGQGKPKVAHCHGRLKAGGLQAQSATVWRFCRNTVRRSRQGTLRRKFLRWLVPRPARTGSAS
jgi:outer membrane murein-binding lipoprotein Lpp